MLALAENVAPLMVDTCAKFHKIISISSDVMSKDKVWGLMPCLFVCLFVCARV